MRFTEIANPEDQLALWKLISDKMWAAFAQPAAQGTSSHPPHSSAPKGRVASPAKPVTRPIPKTSHNASTKSKAKAVKPKRAPMAPLPKPKAQQLTPTQATKQQTQQHQQLAQHLSKELAKPQRNQKLYPQPPPPIHSPVTPVTPVAPMNNSYDERNKDELVLHSRAQNPFKTIGQTKSTLLGQKRSF